MVVLRSSELRRARFSVSVTVERELIGNGLLLLQSGVASRAERVGNWDELGLP